VVPYRPNVKAVFMSLYKDHVLTKFPKQINLQEVDHMVVVDTRKSPNVWEA